MQLRPATTRWIGLAVAVAGVFIARQALGDDANPWPDYPLDPDYFRGSSRLPTEVPGHYLSIMKISFCWLLFLCWVYTTDWINQDAQIHRQKYNLWNPIAVGVFAVSFMLVWWIPYFWFGFSLMVVAYIAPLATYILYRNSKVESHNKVLTREHLRHWFARQLRRVGIKIEAEQMTAQQVQLAIQLSAKNGASAQENEGQSLVARQLPGYEMAQKLMIDAIANRADGVLIDVGQETAAIRYLIDGVWHNCPPQPAPIGESMLAVFKTLAWLEPPPPDGRTSGEVAIKRENVSYECRVSTQAAEGTRRLVLRVRSLAVAGPSSLEELGMRAKSIELVNSLVGQEKGLVLFSSAPGGGVTSLVDVVLTKSDRFLRDFCAVEDVQRRERDITNVDVTTYNTGAGESPAAVLPKLLRRNPNVLIVRDLVNADTVRMLSAQAAERLVLATIPARDACEALLRVLVLKVPPQEFAAAVTAVVHSRLLRRLCERCKEPYPASPELLKQLGIPAGKVEVFYRPRLERPEQQAICEACRGIGYRGRIGIYEVLSITSAVRAVLAKTPQIDPLRKAAREAGMVSARDQAILLAAKGVTSLDEVQRVFKA